MKYQLLGVAIALGPVNFMLGFFGPNTWPVVGLQTGLLAVQVGCLFAGVRAKEEF